MSTTVAVVGAAGRMGRLVVAELLDHPSLSLHAAVVSASSDARGVDAGVLAGRPACGVPTRAELAAVGGADVVVDFSTPGALAALLEVLDGEALVSGTTGLEDSTAAALGGYAERAAVLHAANFSTGVAALRHLVAQAARALPGYDVEIVEVHHHHKRDAPSGTAAALLGDVAGARGVEVADVAVYGRAGLVGARPTGEIGVHAVRAGDVVGEHAVWLVGGGERLVISHAAHDRAVFARGAVRAAQWIAGRAVGRYAIRDVLDLD